MIINNTVLHTHEIVNLLTTSWRFSNMPEKTYRIKFNGKFIRIKNKSEWDKIGSAKSAFKALLRRNQYNFTNHVNGGKTGYGTPNYYYVQKEDLDAIYNQLIADNVLEFVEVTE